MVRFDGAVQAIDPPLPGQAADKPSGELCILLGQMTVAVNDLDPA